jgi:hypothetical protein
MEKGLESQSIRKIIFVGGFRESFWYRVRQRLFICICTVVWWNRNVKTTFQGEVAMPIES